MNHMQADEEPLPVTPLPGFKILILIGLFLFGLLVAVAKQQNKIHSLSDIWPVLGWSGISLFCLPLLILWMGISAGNSTNHHCWTVSPRGVSHYVKDQLKEFIPWSEIIDIDWTPGKGASSGSYRFMLREGKKLGISFTQFDTARFEELALEFLDERCICEMLKQNFRLRTGRDGK